MSKKFYKNRNVEFGYVHVPLKYTFIKHRNKPHCELVLVDDLGTHYVAAYRNMKRGRCGPTFLLKKTKKGFIFRGRKVKHRRGGWVL